jgi:hypothetical protein
LPDPLENTMKYIIVALLFLSIFFLFRGLFTLVKDKGKTTRTVNSLTWRVGFSVALIVFILVSYKAGWIQPNKSPYMYKNKSATPAESKTE